MKTLISQSEFANLVNANQGTISKYVKQGKLPANGKKLIMPDAEKAYHLLLGGMPNTTPQNSATYVPDNNHSEIQNAAIAKTAYQTYQAKIKKLEYEKLNGSLISIDDVIKEVQNIATVMRAELFTIPAKVAPTCEGKSISQIETIIHNAINESFVLLNNFDAYQFCPDPVEN